MAVDLESLVYYYVDRLIFQYRTKPKARATIAIIVKQALADGLFVALRDAFDVDTADGKQLDIIGKYVGVSRAIGEVAAVDYFGFRRYNNALPQNNNGFAKYESSDNASDIFYRYAFQGQPGTDVSDVIYRLVLKLKIITNHMDSTHYSIQRLITLLFDGQIYLTDNMDMTMTYQVSDKLPLSPAILAAYLPKPMGVGISLSTFADFYYSVRVLSDGDGRETSDGDIRVTARK